MKEKKPGFTLIEMIIVVALTLIVIGITSSIFITGNRVFSDSDVNTTLQMEGQRVQEKISDIVMQAEDCIGVSSTKMIINSYDKNGDKQKVVIEKEGDQLVLIINDTDKQILSGKLKNLDFIYKPDEINPSSVSINLELVKKDVVYPINFNITFRNKKIKNIPK